MRTVRHGGLVLVAVALAALLAASSATARSRITRRAQGHASGAFAVAQTSATVARPARIEVRVASSPRQRATISWSMVCSETGFGAGSKSGQADRRLPARIVPRFPARARRLTSCIVSANAQLASGGRLTIAIWARTR